MKQVYSALYLYLQVLGVKVPHSVVRHLLDTPVGMTLRGISDALDLLQIENNVYQLPKEYLKELDYPYLMVLPNSKEGFAIITNDNDKEKALPKWDGVVLAAKKTNATPIYNYVWLRDAIDNICNSHLELTFSAIVVAFAMLLQPNLFTMIHVFLSLIGIWVSISLLRKDYSESNSTGRYCKIGRFIDCQSVLDSKGSRFLRFLRLSDLGFLFFSTQLFLALISNNGWQTFSLILLIIGCCFTVYSVVYQITVIHKVCLYCMSVNLITWLDTILVSTNAPLPKVGTPYIFIFSVLISYLIWSFTVRNMSLSRQTYSLRNRLSVLYRRGLFEWLLSQERELEEISDNYAECSGINETDTITVFVHPQCKKCKTVEAAISQLSQIARVKIVSLAAKAPEVRLYCERNQIVRTPTIVVDGHELPEVYDIGDLKYILKS